MRAVAVQPAVGSPAGEPATQVMDAVTLVEGSTFAVSGRSGDMNPDFAQGLFFSDTRIVSAWQLLVTGAPVQHLTLLAGDPYRATFLGRVAPRGSQTELLVERHRYIGNGMREDLVLCNLGTQELRTTVSVALAADFADVFAVKDSRVQYPGELASDADGDSLRLGFRDGNAHRGVRISAAGAVAARNGLHFEVTVPPRGTWSASVLVVPSLDGHELPPSFPLDRPVSESVPAQRVRTWRGGSIRIDSDDVELRRTLRRSMQDLGALRIADPEHPDEIAVAAGAPWFMALFGRDSLLTSYLALTMEPDLAVGTLRALARTQGRREEASTEEQPGRILHETRLGLDFPLIQGGGSVYYGTADATPLFVVLLGELCRWGARAVDVDELLPHADRALAWVEHYGDRDGDGFVEYQPMTSKGLANQGWKDSFDGINFADGSLAQAPIALCEVQGYVYAAYLARAEIAEARGDTETVARFSDRAAALKRSFNEAFWLPDRGWFAVGLDRDKRPIDSLTSNIGHCLWSGIVDEDKAPQVAQHLISPEMFSGWGVRTLASSMAAYNPMSYHNGSVWPHDSALVATGLMRYGFVESAQRIAVGLLEAAVSFGGRLPELMCGFDRADYPEPIGYPTSCSPQAWASATPMQLVRMLLGLEPAIPERRVSLAPAWPDQFGALTIHDLQLEGAAMTLQVDHAGVRVVGLPEDIAVQVRPRSG